LRVLAPGILWVAALLASMLSLSRLFAQEHADGSLDQLLLSPHPLALIVLTKIAAHWLASGLPLLLLTPILAQQY
ncbi:heme exporter protein CcmB, partial [Serratia marcescens]